jgi:lysophospholipase L1-like esterase
MEKVHARFTGTPGTLALLGDSITVSLAFWAPLEHQPPKMSPEMTRAHALVKRHLKPDCWSKWRGPDYGNEGSMTIRWADQNLDRWLKKLNPEVALIMFGTNDLTQVPLAECEQKTRTVVQRCLKNGTVVILSTIPPRSGLLDRARQYAEAVRRVGRAEQVPVIDFFAEVLHRRPDDWDGALPKFKNVPGNEYQVPTLISRDGVHPSYPEKYHDFSEDSLSHNGFNLRSYLSLMTYAEVIRRLKLHKPPGS